MELTASGLTVEVLNRCLSGWEGLPIAYDKTIPSQDLLLLTRIAFLNGMAGIQTRRWTVLKALPENLSKLSDVAKAVSKEISNPDQWLPENLRYLEPEFVEQDLSLIHI